MQDIPAFAHLQRPFQPLSALQPHFTSSWHTFDVSANATQIYILHWQHSIQHSKKLEFCNTFKNEYTPSCYLELTNKLNEKKELVKFRIGNHKLIIETGRYSQIARVNRICPTCGSNQIEDEIHLLFHCPKYSVFRDRFYRKLEYHLPYIKRLSTLEATKELMNSDNHFVNIQLLRFILSCLNLRNI